jgi:hypothetical protein
VAATWDDVSAIARELPQTQEGIRFGDPVWKVGSNGFVWVRPLRAKDRDELGDAAPSGVIVGASTTNEGEKLALINEDPLAFFTTAHFDGYASILIALDHVDPVRLGEVVTDAWLARAPKRLAAAFLDNGPQGGAADVR